ncbi:unnamed protein product, partial [Prorocentrum cordatum]
MPSRTPRPDEVRGEAASDIDWKDSRDGDFEARDQDENWDYGVMDLYDEEYEDDDDGEPAIDPNFHSVFGEDLPDVDAAKEKEKKSISARVAKAVTIGEGEAPEEVDELPDEEYDPQELVFGKRVPFKEAGIE